MSPEASARLDEKARWHRHPLNNDFIFSATYYGVSRIPKRLSYGIGWVGTWLACRCFKESTGALLANFRSMFPEKSEKDLDRLALETYRSYARDTIDFIRSLSMTRERLARLIVGEGSGIVDELLDAGRGILLVTGHMGNWELGGVILRKIHGYPLTVVAMDEVDPGVTRWRFEFRRSLGIETIFVRRGPATALQIRRLLAENRIVGLMFDRHVGQDKVDVEFFGRRTLFLHTPALMSYFTGAPLLPTFVLRRPDGRFEARAGPPVYVERDGEARQSVQRATQALATILEREVRERPHLWYQFYPYWHDGSVEPPPPR